MGAEFTRLAIPVGVGAGALLSEKFLDKMVIKDAFVHAQLPPDSDNEV